MVKYISKMEYQPRNWSFSQLSQHIKSMMIKRPGTKLSFSKYGKPVDVIHKENYPIPEPKENEVLLEMLAAAVNPVDINIIRGKYPMNVDSLGYEGVARVIKLGPGVKNLKVDDHVVPLRYVGTWRTHLTLPEQVLLQVPKSMGLAEATTLTGDPCTVYRVLEDFVNLQTGDTVIQNGADSVYGQIAIQLCRARGINTVNVVRDRQQFDELKGFLQNLGATYVFTEEEIGRTDIFKTGKLEKPSLALDCLGGRSASEILRHLDFGGVMVTYGGISIEPISVPTSSLIFRDIQLVGFNINRWMGNADNAVERADMYKHLVSMVVNGDLKASSYILINFDDYKEALSNTSSSPVMVGKKYIMTFSEVFSKM